MRCRKILSQCELGHEHFHVFNSFFWKKLTERSGDGGGCPWDAAFERVKKWTKVQPVVEEMCDLV